MSHIDFSKKSEGSVPVSEHAPAPTQGESNNVGGVGVPATTNTGSLFVSDRKPGLTEIRLPRINLVASVGTLKDSFTPGSYVFNQRVTLYTPPLINTKTSTIERAGTPPLNVTYLAFRPMRWAQNVKGGARGLICNSEAEVVKAGGTTNFKEWQLKAKDGMLRFDPLEDCLIAIERPEICEDDDTVFVFPVDGKKYALAIYGMKGSAWTVLKDTVHSDRSIGCLRGGYETHSYALSARLDPTPDKTSTYWKPVLVPNKKNSPAFLEWAKSVLQAPHRDSEAAE